MSCQLKERTGVSHQSADEARLINLLDRFHTVEDDDTRDFIERQIIELVDHYFRQALRPVMTRVFGAGVARSDCDTSVRYTTMVHDFFVKVLEKRPDAFWKARTARDLRTWASVVMRNQMLDYLSRRRRGTHILQEMAPLIEQRQQHFEERFQLDFEETLNTLNAWELSEDRDRRLFALVLRHRYVDGMPYDQIADQIGYDRGELKPLYRLRDQAVKALQKSLH